jgi:serine protease Do
MVLTREGGAEEPGAGKTAAQAPGALATALIHTAARKEKGMKRICQGAAAALIALLVHPDFAHTNCQAAEKTNGTPKLNLQPAPLNRETRAASSFAPVIKKVSPSVVNIYSSMTIRERPMNPPFSLEDPFRRFFGEEFDDQAQPRERKAQSLGSGVVISEDGFILTANHVVEGADKVKVALASGEKEFEARIVGTDPPTDIAVLKVDGKAMPALAIGDSGQLEVGDVVLAIGNPFGVGQTVTMGIVSAVGRGGFNINAYEDFIQTDAAINLGNSGGALVDAEGRLVGINTAIFSRTGGNMGIGFAVPINMARYVMDRITTEGKVSRGYLGIHIQPLTPDLAKEFNLPDESGGVLVGGVVRGGAADKAGIKAGDVIIEFNGKKVSDPRNLQLSVAQTAPGTKLPLRVLHSEPGRKPSEKSTTVTLTELPPEVFAERGRGTPQERGRSSTRDALDGVEVTDLDSRTRRRFEIPNEVRGALVTGIDPDAPASQSGLRPGDVIVQINRQPVRNADEAAALSDKIKGDHVLLHVWSQGAGGGPGGTRFVVVENPKRK